MPAQRQHPARLKVFYLLYFMSVGVSLPFLPPYLQTLNLSAAEVGVLLSINPALAMLLPPLWGQWVDRSRRPGRVLLVLCLGGLAGVGALWAATGFGSAFLAMALMSSFLCGVTSVVDTVAFQQVEHTGEHYASIRGWGSVGFVITALGCGLVIVQIDRSVVSAIFAFLTLTALWTALALRNRTLEPHAGEKPSLAGAWALLRRPQVGVLLLATALHWVASAPFHTTTGIYFTALHFPPWTISASSTLAVLSEVVVMALTARRFAHVEPRTMLLMAFATSILRWLGMGLSTHPLVLCSLAVLHGVSFGTFYIAAVTAMTRHAPGSLRATGQALLVAVTFGIAGLVGNSLTGVAYDAVGGSVFLLAAGVEVLALWVASRLHELPRDSGENVSIAVPRE